MAKRPVSVLEPAPAPDEEVVAEAVDQMSDVEIECRGEHDWPPKWNRRVLGDITPSSGVIVGEQRKKCRRCKVPKVQWVNVLTGHIIKTFPYDYSQSIEPDYVKKNTGHLLQTVNGRAAIRVKSWHLSGFNGRATGETPTDA